MAEPLLKSDADGVRGWLNVLSRLNTIRSRLYLAFGLAAGMTVVGSLFALYASANISATMTEIVSRSMPATVESLRLAEEASTLVASAPRLMTASDDNRRDEIARDIAAQSQILSDRIARLRQLDAGQNDEIEVARAAMVERLDALNQAVTERLKISAQRRALALSVRRVHEDILEAITPAIDDANFDLMTRDQAAGGSRRRESVDRGAAPASGNPVGHQSFVRAVDRILDGDGRRQSGADARSHSVGAAQHRRQLESAAADRADQENRGALSKARGGRRQ